MKSVADNQSLFPIREIVTSYGLRLLVYSFITLALFQLVYLYLKGNGSKEPGAEGGLIENSQVALALFASVALFIAAVRTKVGRASLVVCGAMVAYAAARESDSLFETYLFEDAYKWVVGLPMVLIAVATVYRQRYTFVRDALSLLAEPAGTMFVIAGIYLAFVCQILDRPAMWSAISDHQAAGVMKGTIEETMELFAYLLLAFSGIEALFFVRRAKTQ